MITIQQDILRSKILDEIERLKLSEEQAREVLESIPAGHKHLRDGVLFRGVKFFSPFCCMNCGITISFGQFCFARVCGQCDCGGIRKGHQKPWDIVFSGEHQLVDPDEVFSKKRFVDPASDEGKQLRALIVTNLIPPLRPRYPRRHEHPGTPHTPRDYPR